MIISSVRKSITTSVALSAIILGAVLGNSGCATTPSYGAQKQKHREAEQALLGQDANPKTVYGLARLYIAQDKEEQGEMVLMRMTGRFPRFTPAYVDLAKLHVKHGRTVDAIAVLSRGIEQAGPDAVLHNNVGICHLLLGAYEEALSSFQKASDIVPYEERYQANTALALGLLGNTGQSRYVYAKLLSDAEVEFNMEIINNMRKATVQRDELMEASTL